MAVAEPRFELGPPHPAPPRRRVDWAKARRSLRLLIDEPERTDQVFELIGALAGNSGERSFQRFRRHPDGARLLSEMPSLLDVLQDRATLSAMPAGSFGSIYAHFMESEKLEARGLLDAASMARDTDEKQVDPERRFYFDRLRDTHDLWHVLTGYGRDLAGEAANLAFTYGQGRNRGIGAIVLTSAWLGPKADALQWQRYLVRAWWRGRRAVPLDRVRYEELFPLPLSEVRRRLKIEEPERAHPNGVIIFGDESAVPAS